MAQRKFSVETEIAVHLAASYALKAEDSLRLLKLVNEVTQEIAHIAKADSISRAIEGAERIDAIMKKMKRKTPRKALLARHAKLRNSIEETLLQCRVAKRRKQNVEIRP